MELPRKDELGCVYLSYSQISLFKRSKEEYKKSYIDNEPFEGNEYTEFGKKVGTALENNDFSNFDLQEQATLSQVTRLDTFERLIELSYDDFYVKGYVDTITKDCSRLIEYKTGGRDKEYQYSEREYYQPQIYALAIKQETGSVPEVSLEFIRRIGNLYRDEELKVGDEAPITIPCDLDAEYLKFVYHDIKKVAKEIEQFYKENRKG